MSIKKIIGYCILAAMFLGFGIFITICISRGKNIEWWRAALIVLGVYIIAILFVLLVDLAVRLIVD